MKTEFYPIPNRDVDAYFDLLNDRSFAVNAGSVPHPITRQWAAKRLAERRGDAADGKMAECGLYEKGVLVGSAGYFYRDHGLEIGYGIHRDHRGRGLATTAAQHVIKLARDHRRTGPISANYFCDNPASGRVLAKVGFIRTGEAIGRSAAREGDIPSFIATLSGDVALSPLRDSDHAPLFAFQNDHEAHFQAGGGRVCEDEAAYRDYLGKAAAAGGMFRTILLEGAPVGYIASFDRLKKREISYWIGREHWGQGIASKAVALWLDEVPLPAGGLFARAAKDHPASARVLTKNGFTAFEDDTYFSDIRGAEVEEVLYRIGG